MIEPRDLSWYAWCEPRQGLYGIKSLARCWGLLWSFRAISMKYGTDVTEKSEKGPERTDPLEMPHPFCWTPNSTDAMAGLKRTTKNAR